MTAFIFTEFVRFGKTRFFPQTSEEVHQVELQHVTTRRHPARYAQKTTEERQRLRKMQAAHPDGKHAPTVFNQVIRL